MNYMKKKPMSNDTATAIFGICCAIIIFLAGVLLFDTSDNEPDPNAPDFRPWFEKDESQWTEKDKQDYWNDQMERINEKAEREKAYQ